MTPPAVMLDRHLAVAVDPGLPAALLDAPALARVHRLAAGLPADLTDFFGFECRLAEAAAEADFLVCTKAARAATLATGLPAAWGTQPAWSQLAAFARRWQQPGTPWQDQVQNVWMEFDLAGADASGPVPVPSVFLGTDALPGGAPAPRWLADEALPLLRGEPLPPALRARLDALLARMPSTARVFQLGMMLARPQARDALRVCLRGLTREQALAQVRAEGWPGAPDALAEAWDFAAQSATDIDLDLDLLPGCGPKLGLECSFGFGADAPARLQRFLDGLASRGVCLPAKRDGLLAWTRILHARQHPGAWPADLQARAAAAAQETVSMFTRWVYHVKLVLQPERLWEAKAYLAVAQTWMTPALMQQVKNASAARP